MFTVGSQTYHPHAVQHINAIQIWLFVVPELHRHSASLEMPFLLCNLKVHYYVQQHPTTGPNLHQFTF